MQSRLERFTQKHVFSRLLDGGMRGVEPLRSELLHDVQGRVVEIGFGTGTNLDHYRREGLEELVAIEPAEGLAELAKDRLARWTRETRIPSRLEIASGTRPLDLERGTFDAVVITFVLCSVRHPDAMLAEARRLLRPEGRLVIAEHVAAPPGVRRRAQRIARPVWKRVLAGCDPLTDARTSIERAGFDHTTLEDRRLDLPWLVRTGLVGTTRQR
jgi:SAM-dependent methyltransferase